MITCLLMSDLHEGRNNLREKDFSLMNVEYLKMDGILQERFFYSYKNKVLCICSVKDYYFCRKNMWIEER